jgi:hypothetical protein
MGTDQNPYAKVIAQAWSDEEFKQRLKDDARAALAEHGIDVPQDKQIEVVENTAETVHLVLPAQPEGEISEKELANVAGGGGTQVIVQSGDGSITIFPSYSRSGEG